MLRFADRVDRIRPFEVMELAKRASALAAQGHSVIPLALGEPDFTAPPAVVAALERTVSAGRTQYTPALGLSKLREAIATYYQTDYGQTIDPERIVVTAGGSGALVLAFCALINGGEEVLMADPGYTCNRHFVAAFDGVPRGIPVGAAERFQLTAESVGRHWQDQTRGVLLASPSNPTGTSLPWSELAAITEAVRARKGFTIVDEIYLGLSYPEPGSGPVRSAVALGDDVIVCNSFSKYFNMTGWRLGWLVVPPGTTPIFEKLSQNLFICPSTLAQTAALACFTPESRALYEERRLAFKARRDFLVPALREMGLGVPVMPDGAFYVYTDCSASGLSSTEFARTLLETEYVALVPGIDFGRHEVDHHLRLSYSTDLPRIEEAVGRMRRFMASRTGRIGG